MVKYYARFRAIEKKIPSRAGKVETWLTLWDGTLQHGTTILTREQYEQRAADRGEEIKTLTLWGDPE
jgi:hypothetical protein